MQTSFHLDGLDFSRAPDLSGLYSDAQRYNSSGESLDALKARTTPIDNTNPYTSSHASCANAFIATAISIEHRYDEIHLQLPLDGSSSVAIASPVEQQRFATDQIEASQQPILHSVMQLEAEPQWDFNQIGEMLISPQAELGLQPSSELIVHEKQSETYDRNSDEPQPAPQIELVSAAINEVAVISEYLQDNGDITFSGNAPAGSVLHFYLDDVLIGSSEIAQDGHWQFDLPANLPASQYTFSAVPFSSQGTMGNKIDFPFTVEPKLEAMLLPVDETELENIHIALIDLVTSREEIPVTLLPPVLTEERLDSWRTQDGISVFDPIFRPGIIELDELENTSLF